MHACLANGKMNDDVAKQTRLRRSVPLKSLPRPLYGHIDTLPNRVLGYRHKHAWHQLAHAGAGILQVRTARAWFVAPPQRAVWIPAGVTHRVYAQPGTQVRSLYAEASMAAWATDRCRVISVSPLLRELVRSFGERPVRYEPDGPDARLVQVLLDELATAPDVGLELPMPTDPGLKRLCTALQAHPDSRASLSDWSRRLEVSGKTLSRHFTRETGLGFRAWRQRMRLLQALPALERGESVTRVALDHGYDSVSAFSAAFKRQFGASPASFRGKHEPS